LSILSSAVSRCTFLSPSRNTLRVLPFRLCSLSFPSPPFHPRAPPLVQSLFPSFSVVLRASPLLHLCSTTWSHGHARGVCTPTATRSRSLLFHQHPAPLTLHLTPAFPSSRVARLAPYRHPRRCHDFDFDRERGRCAPTVTPPSRLILSHTNFRNRFKFWTSLLISSCAQAVYVCATV